MLIRIFIAFIMIATVLSLHSKKADKQVCDYAFGTQTYPNPSFYFEKDQNGTYHTHGRIFLSEVRNDNKFRAFFRNYLNKNVDYFLANVTTSWNCTPVTPANLNSTYPNTTFPWSQFINFFNSEGFVCVVPENSVLAMWRSRLAPRASDQTLLGPWGSMINYYDNVKQKDYSQLLFKLRNDMVHQVKKYKLTAQTIKAQLSQDDNDALVDYLTQALTYNVAPKDMDKTPNHIQSVQKQYVRILPPGAKFYAGRFSSNYSNYVLPIHTTYQAQKECIFDF